MLGISRPTADRYWAYAKVRLYCEIYEPDEVGDLIAQVTAAEVVTNRLDELLEG